MIPITFTYQGKEYSGHFNPVSGAAGKLFHLMVDNYYWGQLFERQDGSWGFGGSDKGLSELTDYFVEVVNRNLLLSNLPAGNKKAGSEPAD